MLLTAQSVGLHLADASVFISCAMSLAVFDISKRVGNGVTIEPIHGNTTGTIRYVIIINIKVPVLTCYFSHPEPFQCCITPRSEKAIALILAESS